MLLCYCSDHSSSRAASRDLIGSLRYSAEPEDENFRNDWLKKLVWKRPVCAAVSFKLYCEKKKSLLCQKNFLLKSSFPSF